MLKSGISHHVLRDMVTYDSDLKSNEDSQEYASQSGSDCTLRKYNTGKTNILTKPLKAKDKQNPNINLRIT